MSMPSGEHWEPGSADDTERAIPAWNAAPEPEAGPEQPPAVPLEPAPPVPAAAADPSIVDRDGGESADVEQPYGTEPADGTQAEDEQADRLAVIEERLEALLRATAQAPDVAEALAGLERQITRVGREQFKATTLAEALRDQLGDVLRAFRAAEARRGEEIDAAVLAAQLETAGALLPTLDGLDEALRSARRLLETPQPHRRQLLPWRRERRADLAAWLEGLGFVRDRLLGVLAGAGVRPIPAQGLPFDPAVHVALEIVPPSAEAGPGMVASVIRQGFMHGERVLRPSEVAVVRDERGTGGST